MTEKFGSMRDFFIAIRDASESGVVDERLRISEDWIKLTLYWIAHYRPDLLDEALAIVYHTDEAVNND